jgi:uncharacterized protein (TIGR00369 family)
VSEGSQTFADLLQVERLGEDETGAKARVLVREELLQPLGLLHGGVHSALAEELASHATYAIVGPEGNAAMGQSVSTTFLRPVSEGHVNAAGTVRHRGRSTWVWDVELTDDDGKLLALSRVTVAVRPVG